MASTARLAMIRAAQPDIVSPHGPSKLPAGDHDARRLHDFRRGVRPVDFENSMVYDTWFEEITTMLLHSMENLMDCVHRQRRANDRSRVSWGESTMPTWQ